MSPRWFGGCVVVVALAAGASCGGENLLASSGFEKAAAGALPEGWQKGAHYGKKADDAANAIDATVFRSGSNSLRLRSATGDIPTILQASPVGVKPGERYVFSVCLRGAA